MRLPWQLLVYRHQVISLPPGFGEFLLQKLIKRLQVVHPPVLSCPYFTQIAAQFHKARVPLLLHRPFPVQNLIDLLQYKQGATAIQFRCHWWRPATPQIGQANQGRSLPVGESVLHPAAADPPSRSPDGSSSHSRSGESGSRCAEGIAPLQSARPWSPPAGQIPGAAARQWLSSDTESPVRFCARRPPEPHPRSQP